MRLASVESPARRRDAMPWLDAREVDELPAEIRDRYCREPRARGRRAFDNPRQRSVDRLPMNIRIASLCIGIALGLSACRSSTAAPEAPTPITPLSVEDMQAVFPFVSDWKPQGDSVRQTHEVKSAAGTLLLHHNSRRFTFSVWVDENGRPIVPPTEKELAMMLKRPTRLGGSWETMCFSGCTPNTSGGPPCTPEGCEALDDQCGCTPPSCPTGCEDLGCTLGGGGAIAGFVLMR